MKKVSFVCLVASLFFGCNRQQQEDELLWIYYNTFSFPPEQMDELLRKASDDNVKLFIRGLKYLEACDFDSHHNPKYLDSARVCFDLLKNNAPDDYKGHLGLGLTFTEYPDRVVRFKDTAKIGQPKRDSLFNIAFQHYRKAHQLRPDLAAIDYYWARALFYRKDSVFCLAAIRKLDTVIINRPNFFKAHERVAQFLSYYHAIKSSLPNSPIGKKMSDSLERYIPDLSERVRYHFDRSIMGDSTWYETYEGIANAIDLYPIYERVHYLEKAIRIAERKKSYYTNELIAMRWSIFVAELSNNDAVLNESRKKIERDTSELSSVSIAYYYLNGYKGSQNFDSIITATKKKIKYQDQKPDFWVTRAQSERQDTVYLFFAKKTEKQAPNLRAKLLIELSKWYWTHQRTADAINILGEIKDRKMLDIEIDNRLEAWSDFLENWKQSGSESKISKY